MEEETAAGSELILEIGDKSIYGVIYTPETSNGTRIIMSHGYNGTHNDWIQEGQVFLRMATPPTPMTSAAGL